MGTNMRNVERDTECSDDFSLAMERERLLLSSIFSKDTKVMTENMAPSGLGVDATMGCVQAQDLIAGIDQLSADAGFAIEQAHTVRSDAEVAVLVYQMRQWGRLGSQPLPPIVWCTSVWSRAEDRWQAVFHHETVSHMPCVTN
ncbi:DUF4440 domain-containing protein [Streptomyces collinus]|uniref:DUF4440 domain-containing protein n=1 Tax=Streptomyces collinus TaxID=42684 RepID=UPI003688FB76